MLLHHQRLHAHVGQVATSHWHRSVHAAPTEHARSRRAVLRVRAASLDLGALEMPEIDGDVRSIQQELGATFNDQGVPVSFGNPRQAIAALESGVVLVDRSHWGRVRVHGEGRINFLHGQSTNDFKQLKAGQGCDTVFVTATARTLDLAFALVAENSVMLVVSPEAKQAMLQRMDKYIFPADKVAVQDVSARCAMLSLLGPESDKVLQEIAGDAITVIGQPYGTHQLLKFKSGPVFVAVGSGLSTPGYTIIADEAVAGDLYGLLASKGCYIGQETLAKLSARNGAKQQLWGLTLEAPVQVGAHVQAVPDEARVGTVTSVAQTPEGLHVALAYLRSKDASGARQWQTGTPIKVGEVQGTVRAIPFATRTLLDALRPELRGPGADAKIQEAEEQRAAKAAAAQKEAEAKAERLRAMQERLAAWQAQHGAAFKPGAPQ